MVGRIVLAGLATGVLTALVPLPTLAQNVNFSVVPAEVHIADLLPGDEAGFALTIHNKDDTVHNYTIATFPPLQDQTREGRAQFPDADWIAFSRQRMEITADSQANVTVVVAIPREQRWAARDWETWLAVTAESTDMLAVKLYVRLLVSTGGTRVNTSLVASIAAAVLLLGCGGYYYFRRRSKPE
jgi:hypothetical protein